MRYLRCLLVHEGPSDAWFLQPLLHRALEQMVVEDFHGRIDIAGIDTLYADGARRADHQRPDDVLTAAVREDGTFDALLFHHDGAPQRFSKEVVARMRDAWETRNGREPLVPVVPVRETEAWVLADRTALAETLLVRTALVEKAVPARAAEIESLIDPKKPLRSLVEPTMSMQDKRRHDEFYKDLLDRLANKVSIERLREFPSFAAWWDEMKQALEGLGYRHG